MRLEGSITEFREAGLAVQDALANFVLKVWPMAAVNPSCLEFILGMLFFSVCRDDIFAPFSKGGRRQIHLRGTFLGPFQGETALFAWFLGRSAPGFSRFSFTIEMTRPTPSSFLAAWQQDSAGSPTL